MSNEIKLKSKVGQLSDINKYVQQGDYVAIGGGWSCNKPMAIIREMIRQQIGGLKAMSITGGWEMEWLLGAGLIDHLVVSFLSLEFFGLPANFRRAAEKQTIKITEIEGCSLIKGIEAGKFGMPFAAFKGPKGSDIVNEAPDLYKTVNCPFTGEELTAIEAINPDVAIIHAQRADEQGNVQLMGTSASDMDMAMAAKKVIVTVEEIVSAEEIRKDKYATKLFRNEVDLVIHCPMGASPCSSVPYYSAHLLQMQNDVAGLHPKSAAEYIPKVIGDNEDEYWQNVGGDEVKAKLRAFPKKTRAVPWPENLEEAKADEYTVGDEMVVALARTIADEDNIILGSFTPLAYTAYNLAKLTTAPNSLIIGQSGVDANPFQMGFHFSEAALLENAAGTWSMTECIEAMHFRGVGDIEAVSSAQMDVNGDINISWLPMPIKDEEGNPTGEWNRRALRLPGGAGAPTVFGLHKMSVAYFPSHSKLVFVPEVNYITGHRVYLGDEERIEQGLQPGAMIVVTNLCVMEMKERGKWKVLSLHQGVSAEDVIENTGFELEIPADCQTTEAPTQQEVDLIKKLDPKGIHLLDFMSGKERAGKLPAILQEEWDSV